MKKKIPGSPKTGFSNTRQSGFVNEANFSKSNNEEAVKQAVAHLQTILNHADAGYALYNAELRIVSFNALAQKLSGLLYSKKLVEGNHLLSYFPEDRHQTLLDITRRVLNGEEINYEMHFESLTDGEKWIDVKWVTTIDAENQNKGFILISKDITGKKLAAIEHEKIAIELIHRNKALEQFAYITAHNLRAPVGNIIQLTEAFDYLDDENERKQFLEMISLSAQNLNMVIDDINQLLKIKLQPAEAKNQIYFEQLVVDIKNSISSMVAKEKAAIICDFSEVTYIYSFRSYLYSIFYNFISNAIKYRKPNADPEIHISSKVHNNKIQVVFKDNGKGIDLKKNGEHLFGLYHRFDYSVEGKGMGLFMVKYQVEALDGTINVDSALGSGTTFTLEFPLNN